VYLENDRPLALAALERCDVLLANSLADGMNLVPKEWAIVTRRAGAAVISETAGVAAEAADTSLLVSPGDVERTTLALGAALDMPEVERARRLARFRERVAAWTSQDWLSTQLADLELPGLVGPGAREFAPGGSGHTALRPALAHADAVSAADVGAEAAPTPGG
jgi:trehalose-6-phosphate synthase